MASEHTRHPPDQPRGNALEYRRRMSSPAAKVLAAAFRVRDGARRAFASGGLRGVWLGVLGTAVYRRLLVLERRLEQPPPDVGDGPALRVIVLEDEVAYRALRPDQNPEQFARRRAEGAVCFAAVAGDRVVGATWARPGGGWCDYLERPVQLPDDEVYLFDTMVAPAWRGRRVAACIASDQIRWYGERGMSRLVAVVLPENAASRRARARTGFVVCGRIGWVGLGHRRRHFGSAAAAAAPVERA